MQQNRGSRLDPGLRRYRWRSLLTLLGPLAVLALYIFICFNYLNRPPTNGIVDIKPVNAGWVFYGWFLVSIFILDWARAGAANIEACALMNPSFAPQTASHLMWHADANWANALWWLRGARSIAKGRSGKYRNARSRPGPLWMYLSLTTIVLFLAIALSGLSMELTQVQAPINTRVLAFGPNQTTFATRAQNGASFMVDWRHQIRAKWQSGRPTSPLRGGMLYASQAIQNVSATYFNDEAANGTVSIETFIGPAVRELTGGQTWGISANISCQPVTANKLRYIKVHGYNNYSINMCSALSPNDPLECQWMNQSDAQAFYADPNTVTSGRMLFPVWLNETGSFSQATDYSIVAAADGFTSQWLATSGTRNLTSPFFNDFGHDAYTMDHFEGRPSTDATEGLIELYLWSSDTKLIVVNSTQVCENMWGAADETQVITRINGTRTNLLTEVDPSYGNNGYLRWCAPFTGFGVQCKISTVAGSASISPSYRQFSNFEKRAAETAMLPWVNPLQVQAMTALAASSLRSGLIVERSLEPHDSSMDQSTYGALQEAINNPPLGNVQGAVVYPSLEPAQLQQAIYKLLGESLIALMDEGGVDPWESDLNSFALVTWLVPGTIPWQLVLVLLATWAIITTAAAIWMMFFAGPRWAPSLTGFELFKFGSAYPDIVHEMKSADFQDSFSTLRRIPGMVGMLTTRNRFDFTDESGKAIPHHDMHEEQFIGLSETSIRWALARDEEEFVREEGILSRGKLWRTFKTTQPARHLSSSLE